MRSLILTLFLLVPAVVFAGTQFEEKSAKADAVVLSDETRVEVDANGSGQFLIRKKIKIQTPDGAFANRVVKFDYDPLTAFAKFRYARITGADGETRELDCENACDYAAPARAIYWGARQIMLEIGRLEVGDVLEYEIEKKGFSYALLAGSGSGAGASAGAEDSAADEESRFVPPMRGEFYDIVPFWGENVPVAEKIYSVSIAKPLQYKFYRGNVVPEVVFRADGKTEYTFSRKEILPFEKEKNMVDLFDAAPKLFLTTTRDWREKSVWFHRVNEDFGSFNATVAAQKKVDEIITGSRNDMEKISRLTHWVADNMRYSGISMGEGEGYTLHPTEMNFTDRCGVCKDKAALLISMLRMAGFEAFPAMTMAGSKIESLPVDHFNHSVALVKLSDGTLMPLDPTWVPFVRELWSSAEQQQNYLPGIPGGADLCETPLSPAKNHYLKIRVNGELDASGTLSAEMTISAEGQTDARIRRAFAEGYVEDWQAKIERELAEISPTVCIEKIELGNDWRKYFEMPIFLRVKFSIPNYAAVCADGTIVYTPVVFKNVFAQGRRFETIDTSIETRKYGFRDTCSRQAKFEERIKLPFRTQVVSRAEKRHGSAASFSGTLSLSGRELAYSQTLEMNKRVYEPEDWQEVRAALRLYEKFAKSPVVMKNVSAE